MNKFSKKSFILLNIITTIVNRIVIIAYDAINNVNRLKNSKKL
jgi:hypothetical protein